MAARTSCVLLLAVVAAAPRITPEPGSKRLVVLAGPRTGSSLLVAMLRAHRRQILMHGEPFHEQDLRGTEKDGFDGGVEVPDEIFRRRHATPAVLLDHVAANHRGREVVGFKLFQKHLATAQLPDLLKWATHLVWLRRSNALAQSRPPGAATSTSLGGSPRSTPKKGTSACASRSGRTSGSPTSGPPRRRRTSRSPRTFTSSGSTPRSSTARTFFSATATRDRGPRAGTRRAS